MPLLIENEKGVRHLFLRAARAAAPALRELAFELLTAFRTAPVLAAKLARVIASQERHEQRVRAIVLCIIGDPYRAQIHRQLAPAALKVIAAHHRLDAIRLQEPLYNVRLRCVLGDMDALHPGEDSIC